MTHEPIEYASGLAARARLSRLGAFSLFLSVGGIAVGMALFTIGMLIGFGARGGGPGIPVSLVGVMLIPVLNLAAFIVGIVALSRKGTSRTMAVIGTVLSGVIVVPGLVMLVWQAIQHCVIR